MAFRLRWTWLWLLVASVLDYLATVALRILFHEFVVDENVPPKYFSLFRDGR
jgi:hypothetical protein